MEWLQVTTALEPLKCTSAKTNHPLKCEQYSVDCFFIRFLNKSILFLPHFLDPHIPVQPLSDGAVPLCLEQASQEVHLPLLLRARVSTGCISLARLLRNSWQSWCVHGHKEGLVFPKFPLWEGCRQTLVFSWMWSCNIAWKHDSGHKQQ